MAGAGDFISALFGRGGPRAATTGIRVICFLPRIDAAMLEAVVLESFRVWVPSWHIGGWMSYTLSFSFIYWVAMDSVGWYACSACLGPLLEKVGVVKYLYE
jgi:hypothetical protein